jgi:TonB family protein
MPSHVDILEQRESLRNPFLVSIAVHAAVFSLIAIHASIGDRGRVAWGTPHALGGASVAISAVSQIPLPTRSGESNPLANDTESRVPAAPAPKPQPKPAAPKPDMSAIPLPGKLAQPLPRTPRYQGQYLPNGARPNQLYSHSGQALSSPMFSAQTGTGGVGVGPGSAFGERFGAYRDLLEQRVAQKWRTEDVDPRLQTAPPVIITFEILRDGSIRGVRIDSSSGNRALDLSAQRAIYDAAPFAPLPREYERNSAQIEIWFLLKR